MKLGGWNEELGSSQEADLMFRLLKNGANVLIDNTPLTIINQREYGQISNGSISNQLTYLDLRFEMLLWLQENKNEFYQNNISDLYQSVYNRIRMLAKSDLILATSYYKKLPHSFSPLGVKAKFYKRMIDAFGTRLLSK
jgi:hypothetical protein